MRLQRLSPASWRPVRALRLRSPPAGTPISNGWANGHRKVWVTVTPADKDLLLTMGVLLEWDLDNRASVGQAIERLLEVIRRDHGLS